MGPGSLPTSAAPAPQWDDFVRAFKRDLLEYSIERVLEQTWGLIVDLSGGDIAEVLAEQHRPEGVPHYG